MFMDYRTDYVDKADISAKEARELDETPTFLYAMPMGKAPNGRRRIFFEEVRTVCAVRVASRGPVTRIPLRAMEGKIKAVKTKVNAINRKNVRECFYFILLYLVYGMRKMYVVFHTVSVQGREIADEELPTGLRYYSRVVWRHAVGYAG